MVKILNVTARKEHILKNCLKKQNPPLKKIKDGKNCYEKEKLPLIKFK